MKQLVFALMLETFSNGFVVDTSEMGYWADVTECIWFARLIATQSQGQYEIPILTYCKPVFVDPLTTEIY